MVNPTINPASTTVEECLVAYVAVAAATGAVQRDPGALAADTIRAWRAMLPGVTTVAAAHSVTLTEPVGWDAAYALLVEAIPQFGATR